MQAILLFFFIHKQKKHLFQIFHRENNVENVVFSIFFISFYITSSKAPVTESMMNPRTTISAGSNG